MVIGGEVMETSKPTINRALKHTDYYDWKIWGSRLSLIVLATSSLAFKPQR
jgi:hypothetical protein